MIKFKITRINGDNIWNKHDYQRQFLIILREEGQTSTDQGKDGLRSKLEFEQAK
jgi:uncharacterized protein YqgQ